MAKETVQAVRQAELDATVKEQEALKRKETIISEAERRARELIDSITKQALEQAKQKQAAANQKGAELLEAAKLRSENEVSLMKEMALQKEEEAIRMILASVIHAN
ncbi:MAG: hypothetical protein K0S04_1717 [Herbinix sp.]|jgi:vacuolar-type H+-ATPase subunit H|nr:hypothetical protein [Herbinix sp.]